MTKKQLIESLEASRKALISLSEVVVAYRYLLTMSLHGEQLRRMDTDYDFEDRFSSEYDNQMYDRLETSYLEFIDWLNENYRIVPYNGKLVPNDEWSMELLSAKESQKIVQNVN